MDQINGTTVTNGRTAGGRFAPGNKVAAGTRQAHLQQLRKAFLDCITTDDIADVTASLLTQAKSGDITAAKLLFDRIFGRVGGDIRVDEDEPELSDDQKREQLVARFGKLSPELQNQVRTKLRKSTPTLSE